MECVRDGRVVRFRAQREVVLSTGGFNTPKLLMLSGIGDRSELRALNIPVRVHSPEVGKNVQDHILHGGCLFEAPEPFEYRNSAANVSGYLKTDPSFELPDVSLVQIELPYTSEVIAQQFPPPPNTWALCGGLVAPKSRGTVRLRSANPADRPIVDMRFLSHPDDVAALERSIELAREVGASASPTARSCPASSPCRPCRRACSSGSGWRSCPVAATRDGADELPAHPGAFGVVKVDSGW